MVGGRSAEVGLHSGMVAVRLPVGLPQLTEGLLEHARRRRQRQTETHRTSWQGDNSRNHELGHFIFEQDEAV